MEKEREDFNAEFAEETQRAQRKKEQTKSEQIADGGVDLDVGRGVAAN